MSFSLATDDEIRKGLSLSKNCICFIRDIVDREEAIEKFENRKDSKLKDFIDIEEQSKICELVNLIESNLDKSQIWRQEVVIWSNRKNNFINHLVFLFFIDRMDENRQL